MTDTDRHHLRERLQAAFDRARDRMIDAVADAPDAEMFRSVERQLRDAAHDLAAEVHHAGLDARKKGGTTAPLGSAPTASPTPGSSATAAAPC